MSAAKVLVVDDERDILDMLSRSLEDEGYPVLAVDSGEGAVARVRKEKPEVALLAINTPGTDGIETLSQIREFDKGKVIYLIFVNLIFLFQLSKVMLNLEKMSARPRI